MIKSKNAFQPVGKNIIKRFSFYIKAKGTNSEDVMPKEGHSSKRSHDVEHIASPGEFPGTRGILFGGFSHQTERANYLYPNKQESTSKENIRQRDLRCQETVKAQVK